MASKNLIIWWYSYIPQVMLRKQDTALRESPKPAINSWVLTWNMNRTFYRLAIYDFMIQAISWQLTHSAYGASYWLLNTHIALQDFPQFTDGRRGGHTWFGLGLALTNGYADALSSGLVAATEVGRKGGVQALGGNEKDSALSFDSAM